ncbi:MAG TPA: hypothetical protein VND22_09060 [Actinomycetota bacterium]|nr:hypothetical protein [Actinomycetota bacterium]
MKRVVISALMLVLVLGALVPSASAVEPVIKFEGSGAARALDLSVPGLARLAPAVANALPALTLGHTSADFSSVPAVSGLAAGTCNLLSKGVDPLKACSDSSLETSLVPGGLAGDNLATCDNIALPVVVTLATSCGMSNSKIVNGAPVSVNEAGVATVNLSLDLSALAAVEAVKDDAVAGVQELVNTVFGQLPVNPLTAGMQDNLQSEIDRLLQAIAEGGQAAVIKIGTSSTIVDNAGTITTVTSKAAGAQIGLLGLTNALEDGLVQIEVSSALATAKWDSVAGIASSHSEPALAKLKVRDILNLVPGDYVEAVVNVDALNGILGTLNNITPLLATEIKASDYTKDQTGSSVFASASGVEIHALKGLGASSPTATDGGLSLRLAAANVAIAGDIAKPVEPPMPLTGGPTYMYIAGAILLAGAAFGLRRMARGLNATV